MKSLEVCAISYHQKHFFESAFIKNVLLVGGAVVLPHLVLQAALST